MPTLDLTKKSRDFLDGLPPKQFRQVVSKIFALMRDPQPPDSSQLIGAPEYRRADIGKYRIVYRLDGDVLRVDAVGKRNDGDVYRRFKRGR